MQGEKERGRGCRGKVHSFLSDARHCQVLEIEDDEPQPLLSRALRQPFSSTQHKWDQWMCNFELRGTMTCGSLVT